MQCFINCYPSIKDIKAAVLWNTLALGLMVLQTTSTMFFGKILASHIFFVSITVIGLEFNMYDIP
ncbi:hypothetical protein GIB67_011426, partial [Kingdonia uniflora]